MATITFKGNPIHTLGELPEVGQDAPGFKLVAGDLSEKTLADFEGQRLILNIVPSVDTGICAASARRFNQEAAALENVKILTISADLPFAQGRFCAAEGIDAVVMLSTFRASFGEDYNVVITDGPFAGLLSRAVLVLDADHKVIHAEQVPEIAQEPNYQAALDALS